MKMKPTVYGLIYANEKILKLLEEEMEILT